MFLEVTDSHRGSKRGGPIKLQSARLIVNLTVWLTRVSDTFSEGGSKSYSETIMEEGPESIGLF